MHVIIKGHQEDYVNLTNRPESWLLLKDGRRFSFDIFPLFFYDQPDITNNLVEVESFAFGRGKWMLGSQPLCDILEKIQNEALSRLNKMRAGQHLPRVGLESFNSKVYESPEIHFRNQTDTEDEIIRKINSTHFDTAYVRRWGLSKLIESQSHVANLKNNVCAVAWFEGKYTPVLLRSFSEIKSPQTALAESKLASANEQLEKVTRAAALTLEEALNKWFRFDPPGMKTETKAKIEKAVKLYTTDPELRSLSKIAKMFNVAPKTVSLWFKSFTEYTHYPVVTHRRHESVSKHVKREIKGTENSGDGP